jgi:hypothetical protein
MKAKVQQTLSLLVEYGQSENDFIDGGMTQDFFEEQRMR